MQHEVLSLTSERPLDSVSANVDEGNIFAFGPQESYIENTSTWQRMAMNRRQRCETETEIEARKEACVTRIEAVDDVVREKSVEQSKQKEDEFGEGRSRASTIFDKHVKKERIEHELTHLPILRRCRRCIKRRGP